MNGANAQPSRETVEPPSGTRTPTAPITSLKSPPVRLPTLCIARMRVISRKALLKTAVYRLQPSYWKTRSDSRKRAITQPNRLLRAAYYWQSERACAGANGTKLTAAPNQTDAWSVQL